MKSIVETWKSQNIVVKAISIIITLLIVCCACSVPLSIIRSGRATPQAATKSEPVPTNTPIPADTPSEPAPTDAPVPTDAPASVLSFAEIIQNPDEKSWSDTQYNTYIDSIKGQPISAAGNILEVEEFAGDPYLSLDIEPGEPEIDAYIYIKEDDVLRVGLGQNVTFSGTIDGKWSEGNGYYSLQIRDVELLELGEMPTPTPLPPSPTPLPPTETPDPMAAQYTIYSEEVGTQMGNLGTALGELGQLLTTSGPADWVDDDWRLKVVVQIVSVQLAHEMLSETDVPPGLEEFHASVLNATGDCNTAMDHLTTGLDSFDVDAIELAGNFMTSCGEKMTKLTELVTSVDSIEDLIKE